jgi:cytochrome c oxidase assembly factor CtaG
MLESENIINEGSRKAFQSIRLLARAFWPGCRHKIRLYVASYARTVVHTTTDFSFYMVAIVNGTSVIGRVVSESENIINEGSRKAFQSIRLLARAFWPGCRHKIYVPIFYVASYARTVVHTTTDFSFYMVAIVNGTSVIGRVVPYLLVAYIVCEHYTREREREHHKRGLPEGFPINKTSRTGFLVIFPVMFRQLQPKVGFPWAVRSIGFISLFLASVSCFHKRGLPEGFPINKTSRTGFLAWLPAQDQT